MNTAAKGPTPSARIPKTYAELMAMHLLRPIRDLVDAQNAARMIDLLAGHKLNAEQTDYLDLLGDLYERWENAQCPISRARQQANRANRRTRASRSRIPSDLDAGKFPSRRDWSADAGTAAGTALVANHTPARHGKVSRYPSKR